MTCQVVCKLRLTIFWTVKDSCLNKYTVYVLFCSLQTFAAVDSGQYLVVAVEFSWRFSAAAVVFVGHYIAARVASRIVWITTSCTDNIVRRGVAHCSSSHVHCWHARSTASTLSRVLRCLQCSSFVSYGISEDSIGLLPSVHLLAYFSVDCVVGKRVPVECFPSCEIAKGTRWRYAFIVRSIILRVSLILCICHRSAELLQPTCLVIAAASAVFLHCVVPDIELECWWHWILWISQLTTRFWLFMVLHAMCRVFRTGKYIYSVLLLAKQRNVYK